MWDSKQPFKEIVPVFPLPNVVFFPHTILPLHIFEPRYRKMVQDVMAGNQKMCMVLLKEGWEKEYFANPPIYNIGCVGRIEKCEELADGRFNIFLQGLYKLKIEGEVDRDESYRSVEGTPVKEETFSFEPQAMAEKTHVLLDSLQSHLRKMGLEELFPLLIRQNSSLDALINFVPSVLSLPVGLKQQILEMDSLDKRYDSILDMLAHGQFSEEALARVNFIPEFPKIH